MDAFGCLGTDLPTEAAFELEIELTVVDATTGETPAKVRAFACKRSDEACQQPVSPPALANEWGELHFGLFDVPDTGFDGFVRIEAPGLLPVELWFPRPLMRDYERSAGRPVKMLPLGAIDSFGLLIGRDIDEQSTALVLLQQFDCRGEPAEGVRFGLDPAGDELFFSSDDAFLLDVSAETTGENGSGGLLDVAVGAHWLSVTQPASARELYRFPFVAKGATVIVVDAYATKL